MYCDYHCFPIIIFSISFICLGAIEEPCNFQECKIRMARTIIK